MIKLTRKIYLTIAIFVCFLTVAFPAISSEEKTEGKISQGTIILEPSSLQVKLKEEFKVMIIIKSDIPLIGADARISYDPRVMQVEDVQEGTSFTRYPLKDASKGTIQITAFADEDKEVKGTTTFATLKLKTLDGGNTDLAVEFSPSKTNESNLSQVPASDILQKVEKANISIGTASQKFWGSIKRFLIKIVPYIIFLILLAILLDLFYMWYKKEKSKEEGENFAPEEVPLDEPPPQVDLVS